MNLEEISAQRQLLQEQQAALAEQMLLLNQKEYEIAKEARADGIKKITEIIVQYGVPKHEIMELYRNLNIKTARIPYGTKKNKEAIEKIDKFDIIAEEYDRLHKDGHVTDLLAKARTEPDLDEVLKRVSPQVEATILEGI